MQRFEEQEKTLREAIVKLESLTAEKIAKEKELMEMDLELTRLKKKVEKDDKDRKKEKQRLTTRNEELEGAFADNEEFRRQLPLLQEELISAKKSEQTLLLQITHLREENVRQVAEVEKRLGQELSLVKQEVAGLESEVAAQMERSRRGEHVEATQRKIDSLEKELDRYRQLEQNKFGSLVTERLQEEEKITELSLLIGTYEERALRDAETIRTLQGHQTEVVDKTGLEEELRAALLENESLKVMVAKLKAMISRIREESKDRQQVTSSQPDANNGEATDQTKSPAEGPTPAASKELDALRKKCESLGSQLQRTKDELQRKEKELALLALEKDQQEEDFRRKIKEKDDAITRVANGASLLPQWHEAYFSISVLACYFRFPEQVF